MTAIEVVQQCGDLAVLVAAGIGTASVVVHSQVRPQWWRTAMGRHLMAYMFAMAAVLDLAVIRLAFGASLDTLWFACLRVAVFAAVPAVMGWRLAIQLRARRDDLRHRRSAPLTPPDRGPGRVFTPVRGEDAMDSVIEEYRKFVPQVAYVLLAGWTLIADRVSDGKTIDGVTVVAVVVAIVQALAVVLPGNPLVKAGLSLVTALAQGVTAAWSDGTITGAECAVIAAAFLAWAAGAVVPNRPSARVLATARAVR